MNLKKQSNFKINEYSNKDNQSKILKLLNEIDYGKMVIGLSGLSVCLPHIFPSISVNQILSLIPSISNNAISLGLMGLGGISAYTVLDIITETLKDKNLETQKHTTKEIKENTIREVNTNDLVVNLNKQLLECSVSKDEF